MDKLRADLLVGLKAIESVDLKGLFLAGMSVVLMEFCKVEELVCFQEK